MATVTMTMEEYLQLVNGLTSEMPMMNSAPAESMPMPKKKRSTKYQTAYKKNFKKISKDYQKKDGSWKKNGFRMTVKKSHESTRKGMTRKTARRAYERR